MASDREVEAVRRCLELAQAAQDKSNHPFGALLLDEDGTVLLEAENTVVTEGDKTRHAELNLASAGSRVLSAEVLQRATLVTSTEPCVMCCGAIFWTGIRRVVYCCGHDRLAAHAGAALLRSAASILEPEGVTVVGPVLEDQGEAQHAAFWPRYLSAAAAAAAGEGS